MTVDAAELKRLRRDAAEARRLRLELDLARNFAMRLADRIYKAHEVLANRAEKRP
jgi:hypothetical protein